MGRFLQCCEWYLDIQNSNPRLICKRQKSRSLRNHEFGKLFLAISERTRLLAFVNQPGVWILNVKVPFTTLQKSSHCSIWILCQSTISNFTKWTQFHIWILHGVLILNVKVPFLRLQIVSQFFGLWILLGV